MFPVKMASLHFLACVSVCVYVCHSIGMEVRKQSLVLVLRPCLRKGLFLLLTAVYARGAGPQASRESPVPPCFMSLGKGAAVQMLGPLHSIFTWFWESELRAVLGIRSQVVDLMWQARSLPPEPPPQPLYLFSIVAVTD